MLRDITLQLLLLGLLISCSAPSNKTDNEQSTSQKEHGFVSVFVNFGDSEEVFMDIRIDSAVSVYQLLDKMKRQPDGLHMIDTLYGDLGHLVLGFNGVKNESPKYWVYCLNNAKANKGVDQMMIKNGDKISWYYTSEMKPCGDKKEEL